MSEHVCPKNPNHKRFVTVVHEVHDWLVDEKGDFIEDKGCIETAHDPDDRNIWTCVECGAEAEIKREFINHYECSCGNKWQDIWSATCDDKCPKCGKATSPHKSEDV